MDIIWARSEMMKGKTIYDLPLRVVDYSRVSTEKEEQLNSLDNQVNHFQDMISTIPLWTHITSYVDEGISGTLVNKRDQFLRMINDAKDQKFDLIITKEVSRFARNTIDGIWYTQLLLQYGVIVYFLSDNINTIYPDSEFRLTLMASMAQDEVRKLSERVKFGIQRSIREEKVGGGGLYGYEKKNCKLTICEKEAPAVRMLFSLYSSSQYGFQKIALKLAHAGYFTRKGKIFSDVTLKKMITNPRYKGYYTANLSEVIDYKTHKKVKKKKEDWIIHKDQKGNVPAIVSEEIWDLANRILEERSHKRNRNVIYHDAYFENKTYTSKLFCKTHDSSFIRSSSGKRKNHPVWLCNQYVRKGRKGCITPILSEEKLNELFIKIIDDQFIYKEEFIDSVLEDYSTIIQSLEKKNKMSTNSYLPHQEKLMNLFLNHEISNQEFMEQSISIRNRIQSSNTSYDYLSSIKKELCDFLNISKYIGDYFYIFIDKVYISKINNNRNHLLFHIYYLFDYDEKIEVDFT